MVLTGCSISFALFAVMQGKRSHWNAFGGAFGQIAKRAYSGRFSQGIQNRLKLRHGGSRTQTRNGKKYHQSGATTKYSDAATLYSRKRAPRRIANRMRKFAAKVKSVIDGETGLQVAIRPQYTGSLADPCTVVTTANTQGKTLLPGLWSMNGPGFTGGTNNGWDDTNAVFSETFSSGKLANDCVLDFCSGVYDLRIHAEPGNALPMFVDLYECVARKDLVASISPDTLLAQIPTQDALGGSGGAAVSAATPGWTPFHVPAFCEQWKILKVRRMKMEPGATQTIQFRDSKHRKFEWQTQFRFSALRGVTRCYIPVVHGPPTSTAAVGYGTVYFNAIRSYCYRTLQNAEPSATQI